MKLLSSSLRFRLFVLIMLPLLIVACAAIYWRFEEARKTAADIFDRQLIMICLAVSRDVSYSGGDSLSPTTMNLFEDAAGSPIFYHVYGPDGSFVTGYSSPPVRKVETDMRQNVPQVFDALHLGRAVRAVRLIESVEISGISGASVVTVWQELEPRQNFARDLALKAAMVMALLILTVAGVVIFGIRLGLRPLGQLEEAIRKRNPSDIRPIERQVPFEAEGIVSRLNVLFSQLTQAQEVSDRLISNAAHQLRNPVAAIHSMAQATLAAKSLPDSKDRALQLVDETRRAVRMTNQMLSLEQLRGRNPKFSSNDINKVIKLPVISTLIITNFLFIMGFSMIHGIFILFTAMSPEDGGLGFDAMENGWVFAFIGLLGVIVQGGLIGKITKIFDLRKLMIFGTVICGLGIASIPYVPSQMSWIIFISSSLIAVGNGIFSPTQSSLLTFESSDRGYELGMIMGAQEGYGALARIFGPLLAAYLWSLTVEGSGLWTYHTSFRVAGFIFIIAAILQFKLLRNSKYQ